MGLGRETEGRDLVEGCFVLRFGRDGGMERWRFVDLDLDLEVRWCELDGDLIRFRDQSFLFDSNTYSI